MSSHRAWSHLPRFIAKQQVLALKFYPLCFWKITHHNCRALSNNTAKPANTRDYDIHHQRTESLDPSAEKYPRKFQNVNGSCLPHIAFSKPGFFQAAGDMFQRHILCFPSKAMLLTAGRVITGTQQIITPMIGHEVGVRGRSNFLS